MIILGGTGCSDNWEVHVPMQSMLVDDKTDVPYTFEIASQRLLEAQPLKAKGMGIC